MTKCTFDPTADIYKDAPIGMFHCPECGEMVLAGMPHPDWDEFYKTEMIHPFTQFKIAFEFWVASVFGIYSQDFYRWNEWIFTVPKYTQENLTGRFWQELNEGWEFMQPDMIEYLEHFNSFEND